MRILSTSGRQTVYELRLMKSSYGPDMYFVEVRDQESGYIILSSAGRRERLANMIRDLVLADE